MTTSLLNVQINQPALRAGLMMGLLGMLCSCSSLKQVSSVPNTEPKVNMNERTLLEMNFDDAKAISPQNALVGSLFRVAADNVEVLKTDRQGQPVKVRAKGHVFVEMAMAERATALCEEAILTRESMTLTGNPMVKRGDRVAKSATEDTTFWITEARLRVSGRCELAKLEPLPEPVMLASNDFFPTPEPMLPPVMDPWVVNSENVLLPALAAGN